MRAQKRKLLKLVGLLGAVVCLMGCARTYPEQSSARAMTETTRQQPTETETYQEVSQGKAPPSTATSRIVETVDENFHIDADVVGYPADGMAGIYTGMPKVFTKEEINAFVEYCGGSITSVKEWDVSAQQPPVHKTGRPATTGLPVGRDRYSHKHPNSSHRIPVGHRVPKA